MYWSFFSSFHFSIEKEINGEGKQGYWWIELSVQNIGDAHISTNLGTHLRFLENGSLHLYFSSSLKEKKLKRRLFLPKDFMGLDFDLFSLKREKRKQEKAASPFNAPCQSNLLRTRHPTPQSVVFCFGILINSFVRSLWWLDNSKVYICVYKGAYWQMPGWQPALEES